MKKLCLAVVLGLSACSGVPGPSVPEQPGESLASARAAVMACAADAPGGGTNAVVGSYVGGVLLGGVIIGPIVVYSAEDSIRASGEVTAVDRCLAKRGFQRRDLTEPEIRLLERSSPGQRRVILDHLIGGGTLETLPMVAV